MPEDGRSRLGRGLAALIGDIGAENRNERACAQATPRADRISAAQSAQSAAQFFRSRARGAGRVDQGARNHPAGGRAFRAGRQGRLRDHRRRAALARGAARGPARRFRSCRSKRATARRWSLPSSKTCSARISIRSKRRAAIRRWQASTSHSHEDIAKIVGKSRSHVTNTLRLLKLSEPIKAYINAGKITAGAARMLIGAADPEEMARDIVERGLNVRQVEALAKERAKGAGQGRQKARSEKRRYGCARAARVERARPGGDDRSPRQRRRGADPLSRSRSARRRGAAPGKELIRPWTNPPDGGALRFAIAPDRESIEHNGGGRWPTRSDGWSPDTTNAARRS